jgi:hypothetical protein
MLCLNQLYEIECIVVLACILSCLEILSTVSVPRVMIYGIKRRLYGINTVYTNRLLAFSRSDSLLDPTKLNFPPVNPKELNTFPKYSTDLHVTHIILIVYLCRSLLAHGVLL